MNELGLIDPNDLEAAIYAARPERAAAVQRLIKAAWETGWDACWDEVRAVFEKLGYPIPDIRRPD